MDDWLTHYPHVATGLSVPSILIQHGASYPPTLSNHKQVRTQQCCAVPTHRFLLPSPLPASRFRSPAASPTGWRAPGAAGPGVSGGMCQEAAGRSPERSAGASGRRPRVPEGEAAQPPSRIPRAVSRPGTGRRRPFARSGGPCSSHDRACRSGPTGPETAIV